MALLALSTSALAWWWASRASLTGGRDSFEGLPPDAGFVLAADPSVLLTDAALPRLLHATRRSDLAELLGDLLPSRVRRLLAVGWPEENQAAAALWGSFDAEGFVARLASAEGLERQPAPGRWGREDFAAQLIDGGLLLGTPGGVARLHASLEAPPKSASKKSLKSLAPVNSPPPRSKSKSQSGGGWKSCPAFHCSPKRSYAARFSGSLRTS